MWLNSTLFAENQSIWINMDQVVAIKNNLGGGGSRLQTGTLDKAGELITFVVLQPPAKIFELMPERV